MCGIYGTTISYADDVIAAKLNRIKFRGPDFSSFEVVDGITLGHNRLAIIDLDPRSNQPFTYLHLKIVFNGEIYNYQELKIQLIKDGYRFHTSSDTEVICAAYLKYGENCCNYLNGMFAFVIYDSIKKELFGARDRFGKKPFYYSHSGNGFEFASQPSQIRIDQKFNVNYDAIKEYLIWGYIPEPKSIWTEVQKLPAGYYLKYSLSTSELQLHKYWDLDYDWNNQFKGSYEDAKEHLKELLFNSIKIRLNADVPLGVFLSGGIDSSLVTAITTQISSNVSTFCVKFNEKRFNESAYASMVAKHLGTNHHTIECNYAEGLDLIQNFDRYFDEPFADSSAIPCMLLSKYTKKHVTVALAGDGGDEGFMGYHRYKWIRGTEKLFKIPYTLRAAAAKILNLSPVYQHKLYAKGISCRSVEQLYARMYGGMENSWIIDGDIALHHKSIDILKNTRKPLYEKLTDYDIKTYMAGEINTKADRSSMSYSLEARSPLMDYRVIEFSRSLPTSYKFGNNGVQKKILKDILYKYVPENIFNRPKAGFTMPMEEWFRNELKEYMLDNLTEQRLNAIPGINVKRVLELITEHLSGKRNRSTQIWKLLVLSQWLHNQGETKDTIVKEPYFVN